MKDDERERSLNRLRFPTELERVFQADYYGKVKNTIRAACVLTAVLMVPAAIYNESIGFRAASVLNVATSLGAAVLFGVLTSVQGAKLWKPASFVAAAAITALFHYINAAIRPHLPSVTSIPHASTVFLLVQLVLLVFAFVVCRLTLRWYLLYGAFTLASGIGAMAIWLPQGVPFLVREMSYSLFPSVVILALLAYRQERSARAEFLANHLLEAERARAEALLLNILPAAVAARLKLHHGSIADDFAEVGVLFADIVDFTPLAAMLPAAEVVQLLNAVFTAFDALAEAHGMEKIKTIGDAYMAAAGLPEPRQNHAAALAEMALDMVAAVAAFRRPTGEPLAIRVGLSTGPVVAGVIGTKKFIYDLWGDTVNIASRLESQGQPGTIQCTESAYELLRDRYDFTGPVALSIKGRGSIPVYVLCGRK